MSQISLFENINIDNLSEEDTALLSWIKLHIGKLDKIETEKLLSTKQYFIENKTHELSKEALNTIHTKNKQKVLGIAYTPKDIRKKLTLEVLDYFKNSNIKNLKICDPCCGSGIFTLTLLDELLIKKIDIKKALKNNIYFYDIDKLSVGLTLLNIYLFCKDKNIDILNQKLNTKVQNFFYSKEKYDAFITNPPYVKLQNLDKKDIDYFKNNYSEIFHGAPGLSIFFTYKLLQNLNENGILGVITQNNFFTSLAGKKYRKEIKNHLYRIETFGNNLKFEGVNAYTCLLYLTQDINTEFYYLNNSENFKNTGYSKLNIDKLEDAKWRLGSKKELENIYKLENNGIPLGKACKIWVGIATQYDKAFICEMIDGDWFGVTPSNNLMPVDKKIVKNLIKISKFNNESTLHENNMGVIFPYRKKEGVFVPIKEASLKNDYKKTYAYLETWKNELLGRQKGRIKKSEWYQWGRIQSMESISNKLLTKTFDSQPNFMEDKTDSLFSNGYALKPDENLYDFDFVKQIINSEIFYYYMKLTSFEIAGDFQCYQKNFIEKFCLPEVDIGLQKKILRESDINEYLSDYYGLR
tara:strand:- start:21 stop:1760 length:1740 start_codon:yes stop_codon:yes gene_type:complete